MPHEAQPSCATPGKGNLRTLRWRCLKPNGAERPTPFSAAFLSTMAAVPEPGLRLLQADNCDFCAYEVPAEVYWIVSKLEVL